MIYKMSKVIGRGFPESVFEVKTSRIPKAGLGLFSTIHIKKNERVMEYRGVLRLIDDGHENHDYCFEIGKYCIDASDPKSCKARFANDVFGTKFKVNLRVMVDKKNRRIWYVACRNIKPGTELFLNYGSEYWSSRGM